MSHLHSAGPETQAVTHTDGGVKCGVQVFNQTKQISQLKFFVGPERQVKIKILPRFFKAGKSKTIYTLILKNNTYVHPKVEHK